MQSAIPNVTVPIQDHAEKLPAWEGGIPDSKWMESPDDATADGFYQVPIHPRGKSPSSNKHLPPLLALPLFNRFQALNPLSFMQIDHPQQANIVGENSAPAIYAPNHNISVAPQIYVMPDRILAASTDKQMPAPTETEKPGS